MKRSERIQNLADPYEYGWKYNEKYLSCCPIDLNCGEEEMEFDSWFCIKDKNENIVSEGCRGITCEQCWDKEYEDVNIAKGDK